MSCRLPTAVALGLLCGALCGCEQGYQQGDCEPGYLDVDGECTLAVGPACQDGGDCLSGLCAADEQERRFCTVRCLEDTQCPAEFFCTTWSDRRCYPGQRPPPCQADPDCGACMTCLEGRCRATPGCVPCDLDDECGACGRCEAGACLQVAGCVACSGDADCPTCELCLDDRCQRQAGCLLCAGDQDCPGCTRCDRGGCATLPGCGTDPCFNDLDCPARTSCLVDRQTGLQVCLPDQLAYGADCTRGGDPVCAQDVCLLTSPEAWTCSRACAGPGDCPAGAECAPDEACLFACHPPSAIPPSGDCAADRDCDYGSLCGLWPAADGQSWQPRCGAPRLCAGAAGEACAPDDARRGRCQSGVCTELGACTSVCATDFDCPAGTTCAALQAPLPAGGQAGYPGCAAWGAGLGEVGEPCPAGEADCRSGLCLAPAHGGHPVCSAACTPGLADCPDRFACLPDSQAPELFRCQRALVPGSCQADADCQAGEVCGLPAGAAALACLTPVAGGADPGAPCLAGGDCGAGLCTELGLCAASCRAQADCPAGLACDLAALALPGGSGWAPLCGPAPGNLSFCRRSGDCGAGEVCAPWPAASGAGLQARCRSAWAGGGAPGAACQVPGECAALLCDLGGACGAVCLEAGDCPAHFTCADVLLADGHHVSSCVPLDAGLGQACPGGDGDCASGLCHLPEGGAGYCSAPCALDADCAEAPGMICAPALDPRVCVFP
ncbi:MAG TPA: hypothetical protein PK668_14300 [Myxococcota bacterium]|nr:hypothetical protein [Myxococcota bacterium]HRY93966.1 hypothetical protein [Myxococcota bacterium]